MHPWRDARRARARADQWEQVAALRGREADTLRRDRDAYAGALAAEQERVRVLQERAATGEGVTVARLRAANASVADLQRLEALQRSEIDRLTRERDAWAGRCADAEDTVRTLRDRLTRSDSVAVTALRREVAMLRETVAALDARNDSLRREVAHWENGHAACERARQLVEREAAS